MDNRLVYYIVLVFLLIQFVQVGAVEHPESMTEGIPVSLMKQVEEKNVDSIYFIGLMFRDGTQDIKSDSAKAKYWFGQGANTGHAFSIFELAEILFGEKDYDEARKWYQEASKLGIGEAFYRLAYYPMYGYSNTEINCQDAYKLLDKARLRAVKGAYNDQAWMLSTFPDQKCRSGEKAWKIYSEMEKLYTRGQGIPWGYWDTKAAILAEMSDFNEAIKIQSWVLEGVCDVKLTEEESCDVDHAEKHQEIRQIVEKYMKDAGTDEYCQSFATRLISYLNRVPWREDMDAIKAE